MSDRPCKVYIEVGYDDVSADQSTPSQLNSVTLPSRAIAEKVAQRLADWAEKKWGQEDWYSHIHIYVDSDDEIIPTAREGLKQARGILADAVNFYADHDAWCEAGHY